MNLLDGAVLPKDGEKTADFVIVGSGPAGSAVARAVFHWNHTSGQGGSMPA